MKPAKPDTDVLFFLFEMKTRFLAGEAHSVCCAGPDPSGDVSVLALRQDFVFRSMKQEVLTFFRIRNAHVHHCVERVGKPRPTSFCDDSGLLPAGSS